jgi:hypothetical protein
MARGAAEAAVEILTRERRESLTISASPREKIFLTSRFSRRVAGRQSQWQRAFDCHSGQHRRDE